MENLATKLRRLREMRNLTQGFVADQLNVSLKTYQRIEAGKVSPSFALVLACARLMEVQMEELQCFDPNTFQFGPSTAILQQEVQRLREQVTNLSQQLLVMKMEKERLLCLLEKLAGAGKGGG